MARELLFQAHSQGQEDVLLQSGGLQPDHLAHDGDRYEVLVEGEWTPVPQDTIQNVTAPDGGAHVCAPKQQGIHKGMLYCVVCCRRRREPGRRRICDLAAAFRTRAHRRREGPLLR